MRSLERHLGTLGVRRLGGFVLLVGAVVVVLQLNTSQTPPTHTSFSQSQESVANQRTAAHLMDVRDALSAVHECVSAQFALVPVGTPEKSLQKLLSDVERLAKIDRTDQGKQDETRREETPRKLEEELYSNDALQLVAEHHRVVRNKKLLWNKAQQSRYATLAQAPALDGRACDRAFDRAAHAFGLAYARFEARRPFEQRVPTFSGSLVEFEKRSEMGTEWTLETDGRDKHVLGVMGVALYKLHASLYELKNAQEVRDMPAEPNSPHSRRLPIFHMNSHQYAPRYWLRAGERLPHGDTRALLHIDSHGDLSPVPPFATRQSAKQTPLSQQERDEQFLRLWRAEPISYGMEHARVRRVAWLHAEYEATAEFELDMLHTRMSKRCTDEPLVDLARILDGEDADAMSACDDPQVSWIAPFPPEEQEQIETIQRVCQMGEDLLILDTPQVPLFVGLPQTQPERRRRRRRDEASEKETGESDETSESHSEKETSENGASESGEEEDLSPNVGELLLHENPWMKYSFGSGSQVWNARTVQSDSRIIMGLDASFQTQECPSERPHQIAWHCGDTEVGDSVPVRLLVMKTQRSHEMHQRETARRLDRFLFDASATGGEEEEEAATRGLGIGKGYILDVDLDYFSMRDSPGVLDLQSASALTANGPIDFEEEDDEDDNTNKKTKKRRRKQQKRQFVAHRICAHLFDLSETYLRVRASRAVSEKHKFCRGLWRQWRTASRRANQLWADDVSRERSRPASGAVLTKLDERIDYILKIVRTLYDDHGRKPSLVTIVDSTDHRPLFYAAEGSKRKGGVRSDSERDATALESDSLGGPYTQGEIAFYVHWRIEAGLRVMFDL